MRSPSRRFLRLSLPLLLVSALSFGAAGAAPQKPHKARLSPGYAADVSRLPAGHSYGAFVHFAAGKPVAAQKRFLTERGFVVGGVFHSVDVIYAVGSVARFRSLESDRSVVYLEKNERLQLLGETATWATGARIARQAASGGPYRDASGRVIDGAGVGVAVVDGGVDGTHPDLAPAMVRNFKVLCDPDPNWVDDLEDETLCAAGRTTEDGRPPFEERQDSDTSSGHGSHVAGIVAGRGTASTGVIDKTFVGGAPGAALYGFGVGDGDAILTELAAHSFQWVLDFGATQSPPIKVVTNSWGCLTTAGGCAYDASGLVERLTTKLVDAGITVLFAAGNDGGNGTANCYTGGAGDCTSGTSKHPKPGVISVANYDDNDTGDKSSTLATSSSRGSSTRPETWPDISAPGYGIISACKMATSTCGPNAWPDWAPYYAWLAGTSMATPYVAAAAAMLYQANPSITPAQVEDVLQDTALKFTGGTAAPGPYNTDPQNPGGTSSYDKGAGLLNVPGALDAILTAKDGTGRNGNAAVVITAPAANSSHSGVVSVTGTAFDGSFDAFGAQTLISGDEGDVQGLGSADLAGLVVQPTATGVNYTIRVRNISDAPAAPAAVRLTIFQNVNGVQRRTQVNVNAAGATAAASNSFNTAIAENVTLNTAANSVSFFLPFSKLGNPPVNAAAHNVMILSYQSNPAVQSAIDLAPGGDQSELSTKSQYSLPYTVNPSTAPVKTASMSLSLDGGPDVPATISGTSPNYTWSGSVNLTSLLPGTHTVKATLKLNGVPRTSSAVTIVKPGSNLSPLALSQSVGVGKDAQKLVTLVGSDPENAPFTYKVTSLPAHGQLFNGPNDGYPLVSSVPFTLSSKKVTYKPATGYTGADSFAFRTNDANTDSAAATVSITVLERTTVTIRPGSMGQWSISNEEAPGAAGTFVYGPGVPPVGSGSFRQQAPTGSKQYLRTTNANGIPLSGADLGFATYMPSGGPVSHRTALNLSVDRTGDGVADETLVFEPYFQPLNQYGPALVQNAWQVWDASAGVWWSTATGQSTLFSLSEYLAKPGNAGATIALLSPAALRLVAGSTGNSWPNFDGNTDRAVINGTLYNFDPDNAAPTADSQSVNVTSGTPRTVTLTGDDADGDALSYKITALPLHGTLYDGPNTSSPQVLAPQHTLASNVVTYEASTGYTGPDSFDFQTNDGALDSGTATVSVTVRASNSAPTADPKILTTQEDTEASKVLTGSDPDGDSLTFKISKLPNNARLYAGPTSASPQIMAVPYTLPANVVTYKPNDDFNGLDFFEYKAGDGQLDSAAAEVSVTVQAVNDAPVASSQSVNTPEDTAKQVTLTGTDVDGNSLTFKVMTLPANGVLHDGASTGSPVITTVPFTLSSNKATYAPGANYHGSDAFTFKANDGTVDSTNTATVSISVTPVNDAPTATPQSVTTAEDVEKTITLVGADADGDPITYRISALPASGTLHNGPTSGSPQISAAPFILSSNVVTYKPNANFNGSDGFVFRTHDGAVESVGAPVSITVSPVNDAPEASAQSVGVQKNIAKAVTLTGTDVDGNSLSFKIDSLPANGTLYDGANTSAPVIAAAPYTLATNKVTFLPATGYTGPDSFTFKANDGLLDSAPATVSITVSEGDVTPPGKPVITSPLAGSLKPRTFAITGTAEASSAIKVYDGAATSPFATTTTASNGTWSVSVTMTVDGSHTIKATATDASANVSAFSDPVTFTVDAVDPSVTIASPSNGHVFLPGSPILVNGTASDARGLQKVTLRYRNTATNATVRSVNATCGGGACTGTSVSWADTPALPAGTYDLIAVAYDLAGNIKGSTLVGFVVIGI